MIKKNQMINMIQQYQEQLGSIRVSASSGGGMVTVEMDGTKRLISIKIESEVIKAEDTDMLQDLILAAVNEASRQVDEQTAMKMQSFMGQFGLPPGLF